jgi:hypothetical protein
VAGVFKGQGIKTITPPAKPPPQRSTIQRTKIKEQKSKNKNQRTKIKEQKSKDQKSRDQKSVRPKRGQRRRTSIHWRPRGLGAASFPSARVARFPGFGLRMGFVSGLLSTDTFFHKTQKKGLPTRQALR